MNARALRLSPALLALAAALLHGGCASRAANSVDASAPKAVRVMTVEPWSGAAPTTYSAIVTPNAQVDLAFRVSGYVVEIRQTKGADGRIRPIEAGASVASGVMLGRLRATDYQAVVDRARGGREEATAGITAAEAGLAEARASQAQAESDFARIETLWQQESITKPAYDAAKARLDVARAKVDAATAVITETRQRLASATAQLQEAEIALGDTELHAPFDAILLERRVEVGTLMSAGTPAFTLADLHVVKAHFSVPDTALQMFRVGQPLPLTVDAFAGERLEGRVLSVAAAADPKARSFEITVTIPNQDLKLRSGMIASIRATEAAAEAPQLRIPIDALVHDPDADRYLVYTTEPQAQRTVVKAVPVRPGPLLGNQVVILDGLTAGQQIVVSGANLLRPGDVVKVVQ